MTLEKDISDLKCAFRNYIEIKKRDEVDKRMIDYSEGSEYYISSYIDDKYKSVTDYLE